MAISLSTAASVLTIDDIEPKEVPGFDEIFNNIAGMLLSIAPLAGVLGFLAGLIIWALPLGDKADKQGKNLAKVGVLVMIFGTFFNQIVNTGESLFDSIMPG